ncbi:YcgL domain-containing protein [Arenicella sp. 4NH20-0111]|uniref:YcgL domain-containing protein n=1 Tax=Arenicella sp. 4NH20-0111 TaxID=3127648 RepID=UPI003104EE6B
MQCYVYKGDRKEDHFVYLNEELDAEAPDQSLPAAILTLMGELSFVLEFDLTPDRQLPQADAVQVLADIEEQGFYLQMPKKDMRAEEDRLFS